MNYRAIPHGGRNESCSKLMGRQIISPILCSDEYKPMEEVIYDNKRAKVIVQKGVNTYIVSVPGRPQGTLIHKDQMRRVGSDILNKDNKCKDGTAESNYE